MRCPSRLRRVSGPRSSQRKFVDTVDEKLPALGNEHPSTRQELIGAALDMADRLVHTQYEFLREVVQSAGQSLGASDQAKKDARGNRA
jgi:hypothetical protein